jgi:hypothetical protein
MIFILSNRQKTHDITTPVPETNVIYSSSTGPMLMPWASTCFQDYFFLYLRVPDRSMQIGVQPSLHA